MESSAFENKNLTKFVRVTILLMIILLMGHSDLFAQITDPGTGSLSGTGDPDSAPIDGGLSLLLAAGIGYGAKKAWRKQKNMIKK